MKKAMMRRIAWVGLLISFLTPVLQAQFHAKNPTGQTGVNQQAVNSAQQQSAARAGGSSPLGVGGGIGGGDMVLPEGQRQALSQYGVKLGEMSGKNVDIWGRAIHHTDGSYTESKQDNVTNTLLQTTLSKNGTRLQTRMITLDQMGRPSEAMIYDGRDQFKYRGIQIYDTFGRFAEEQIYDVKGTLIRRKIQEYTPQGEKRPVHSVDYVANVPEDLKLVITRESENPTAVQPPPQEKKPRTGLFSGKKDAPPSSSPPLAETGTTAPGPPMQGGISSPGTAPQAPKKGLNIGRLFSGKKQQ